jgi:hypothetical protein
MMLRERGAICRAQCNSLAVTGKEKEQSNYWKKIMDKANWILHEKTTDATIGGLTGILNSCADEATKALVVRELSAAVKARQCGALAALAEGCGSPLWGALAAMALCMCNGDSEEEISMFRDPIHRLLNCAIDDVERNPKQEKHCFLQLLVDCVLVP